MMQSNKRKRLETRLIFSICPGISKFHFLCLTGKHSYQVGISGWGLQKFQITKIQRNNWIEGTVPPQCQNDVIRAVMQKKFFLFILTFSRGNNNIDQSCSSKCQKLRKIDCDMYFYLQVIHNNQNINIKTTCYINILQ